MTTRAATVWTPVAPIASVCHPQERSPSGGGVVPAATLASTPARAGGDPSSKSGRVIASYISSHSNKVLHWSTPQVPVMQSPLKPPIYVDTRDEDALTRLVKGGLPARHPECTVPHHCVDMPAVWQWHPPCLLSP